MPTDTDQELHREWCDGGYDCSGVDCEFNKAIATALADARVAGHHEGTFLGLGAAGKQVEELQAEVTRLRAAAQTVVYSYRNGMLPGNAIGLLEAVLAQQPEPAPEDASASN